MADFGWAAAEMKEGRNVQREGWAAKGIRLGLIPPGRGMSLPFIAVRRSSGDIAPWQACHDDLLATDWVAVKGGGAVLAEDRILILRLTPVEVNQLKVLLGLLQQLRLDFGGEGPGFGARGRSPAQGFPPADQL